LAAVLLMAGTSYFLFTFGLGLDEPNESETSLLIFSIVIGLSFHSGLLMTAFNKLDSKKKRVSLALSMAPAAILLFLIAGEGVIDAVIKWRMIKIGQAVSLAAFLVYCVAYRLLISKPANLQGRHAT
jgi:hypothetical protein